MRVDGVEFSDRFRLLMCPTATATNSSSLLKHEYITLPDDILNAVGSFHENMSRIELLERYVGGLTQNSNENYNQFIWKITTKKPAHYKIFDVAALTAACIFNEFNAGTSSL